MLGDYDECIRQSQLAVELQKTFGPAYNNMGLAYLEKKEYAKAKENFELARSTGIWSRSCSRKPKITCSNPCRFHSKKSRARKGSGFFFKTHPLEHPGRRAG
jgi:hypothetical protein